jgi:Holliday junction resolvase RusA-like endonuclease
MSSLGDLPPREGALWVEVTFRLPRPKGHMGKRGLRPSAPRFPATRPDLDKLCRAVLDGLTSGGAYGDDAQVTVLTAEKVYASETRAPGCTIRVGRMA